VRRERAGEGSAGEDGGDRGERRKRSKPESSFEKEDAREGSTRDETRPRNGQKNGVLTFDSQSCKRFG
jgi:hypothetical protein